MSTNRVFAYLLVVVVAVLIMLLLLLVFVLFVVVVAVWPWFFCSPHAGFISLWKLVAFRSPTSPHKFCVLLTLVRSIQTEMLQRSVFSLSKREPYLTYNTIPYNIPYIIPYHTTAHGTLSIFSMICLVLSVA